MEALISMPSELEKRRLRGTKAQLDQRWVRIGQILNSGLGRQVQEIAVDADYQSSGVWTGLRGPRVERIDRNRGTAAVAQMAPLPTNLFAWLGYQEIWDLEDGRNFYFRQAGLTVHVGEIGDPVKPQLLRLEWAGLKDWHRSGIGFQSPGAGHPHWQLDVFESLQEEPGFARFDPDRADDIENFDDEARTPTLAERIRSLTFEKMHLASAAPWWLRETTEYGLHHLNAPADQEGLLRWLTAALSYIKQELSRCGVRR
jgi:hypothetical protein